MASASKYPRAQLTHERLLALLDYDPITGVFTHKLPRRGVRVGSRAGSKNNSRGYRYVAIDGNLHIEAQLAWFYVHGEWAQKKRPLRFVDGNPNNVSIANLRYGEFCPSTPEGRREYQKNLRKRRPDSFRRADLHRDFGISLADYQRMFVEQGGCCASCKNPERDMRNGKVKWLAVDHDHKTGAVRGLLCAGCNMSIGRMDDDPERLRAAADYIERNKALVPSNVITIKSRRKRAT